MDLIFGRNICAEIREHWLAAVPIILRIGNETQTATVRDILKIYKAAGLDSDFGECSFIPIKYLLSYTNNCRSIEVQSVAALEILPLLIPTGKKIASSRKYLFDVREVNSFKFVNKNF